MSYERNFWVIGGDLRQVKLAELLHADGHTVHTYALERGLEPGFPAEEALKGVERADCVILPLPAAGEGGTLNAPLSGCKPLLGELLSALRPGQVVCAGRVGAELSTQADQRDLRLYDYFAREELVVANAVPGAFAIWLCLQA